MRISDWSSDVCSSDLERPGARDRNGARNALFADLLVTTGLRLEEASHLLAAEIPVCDARSERQRRVELPAALTKGDRGRSMLLPRRLLPVFDAYIAVERAARSEEHTSELQSLMRISYAVFCLKKKKKHTHKHKGTQI